ncbi:MAG: TIGR04076 family protein [Candidatus Aureabacteria bacterium]|nr:TIGR04076 family protein [Candidatus Auribacterota bacterium]
MKPDCYMFKNIQIEVKSVEGSCSAGFCLGKCFSPESIIPKGLCPFLYHAALPYLEAIENGAFFKPSGKNFIKVQCPNTSVGVLVEIFQAEKKGTQIRVSVPHTKDSKCPCYDFKAGDNWIVTGNQKSFCRRAYDSLFPYLNALSSQTKTAAENVLTVTCPSYPDFVTFKVIKLWEP